MSDPVPFFRDVAARHARCFWLDGGGAREWSGRRSIIGWLEDDDVSLTWSAARREVREHSGGTSRVVGDDVFAVLEERMRPGEQWFGYLGYASRPDLPAEPDALLPDAMWMRPREVRVFEHGVGPSMSVVSPHMRGNPNISRRAHPQKLESASGSRGPTPPPESYAAAFARVQEHLRAGNSYEVNLTHRLTRVADLDPVTAYLRLRELNPAPYSGFLQHDVADARGWLLSSSPERYALVTPDRHLETKPIKGTTPRGDTAEEDEAHRTRLAADPKTRAENLMIVDLLRNDLSLVCDVGSVEVPALMEVESYESVHQLVSTVRGHLREGVTTVGALRALFPAGSMTGAPKLRTMQVIEEVESSPRGVYAGAFGWISGDGPADLGVVIRSLTTDGGGTWTLGTGGGITVKSDVAEEWAESEWKAERLLRVFE
ncbi:anthranilate synthase component I family protein [Nocardioides sp. zg-1308]|uniref:anthranilate synthase component I family protein n=1 Tax=Nocardioides sp. zg-1308 TaxID=2736253 RepID=UPI00155691C8|nr:anthranilate synthase component I family protein [Nocardioides sp. zg-1308]